MCVEIRLQKWKKKITLNNSIIGKNPDRFGGDNSLCVSGEREKEIKIAEQSSAMVNVNSSLNKYDVCRRAPRSCQASPADRPGILSNTEVSMKTLRIKAQSYLVFPR